MLKTAVISDGVYRYELTRQWAEGPVACWVMLNPSTADADIDDPTIRRCMSFSKSWGAGGMKVVNLFALRATNPKELTRHIDPTGPLNKSYVGEAITTSAFTVVAWGASAPKIPVPALDDVSLALHFKGLQAWCLGTTKAGYPRHPLYVRADQPLEDWPRKDQP